MGLSESKHRVLYLPAQSGKTSKMEDLIRDGKFKHGVEGECNFIISDNNILLVEQTKARVMKDLATGDEAVIVDKIFNWTSQAECNISSKELAYDIVDGSVEMVVMCSHPKRFTYLHDLINLLNKSKRFDKKINIWIDEADKSIKQWSKYEEILEHPNVTHVTLISATIGTIIKKYKSIKVIPYEMTHPFCYRGLYKSKHREFDYTGDPVSYIEHILDSHSKLSQPGKRAFMPGNVDKASHDEIEELLIERGFAVMVLNGDRKQINIPGEGIHDISIDHDTDGNLELSEKLATFYKDHKLHRFPFAITGRLCLGRGVTFQSNPSETHDGFIFDYAIIPNIISAAEAYQTAARGFGNVIRHKKLRFYSSASMYQKIFKEESRALHTAVMAHDLGLVHIDKYDLKMAESRTCVVKMEEFSSKKALQERWEEILEETGQNKKLVFHQLKRDLVTKKYTCALGSKTMVQSAQNIRDRRYDTGTHEWGSGITNAEPGDIVSRIYIGYENDTDVYFLRWTIKE